MQCDKIDDNDIRQLKQILTLVKKAEFPPGVSMVQSIAIAEALKWFDAFTQAVGKAHQMQKEKPAPKPEVKKTEGLEGAKLKDFNPGDMSAPISINKPVKKAKTKSKRGKK